ncbi:xanthine dehydrogenase family protein subunit M [Bacillus sp. ISL-47]|uniref:FAD binding domain-containing protein n=1 Tax=Bacillus sp. ISL-47 TaxID=2819130 RepID=UPI001BE6E203|nr:xanthine dehydrogenase family protein subunit M [Bacillus sp. ISL-47]MBT2689601.1 xanthine dehydrogenase family protein subunit M [Bacillus sp. ISL-47]MBT2708420.1 xanthine dehydrogenase family protein subunit M [Pseudomonas sp. ISL-84]
MLVSEIDMFTPSSLSECLAFLAQTDKNHKMLAGGTDAAVRMKEGKWRPEVWINIKNLKELRYIEEKDGCIHIGPLTTHTDIVRSPLLKRKADVLVEAAREVGATQMQNIGTIGGNIGTASPAGDTIPALYVLGAVLEISSLNTKRLVPIEQFFTGPGRTVLRVNEMITNILIQPQVSNEIGIFQKLGPRKAQSISIVNVAISLRMIEGRHCQGGKIAFGAVGPTIIRAKKCEALLSQGPLTEDLIQNIAKIAWKEVMPITDVRATATYRRDMASALLERGLYRLIRRWGNNDR